MHRTNSSCQNRRRIFSYMLCHFMFPAIVCFFITFQVNASNEYAVFTLNHDIKQLSKSKVRMLYRGKIKYLQGNRVELSDWSQSNPVRSEFYQKLLGKNIAQMNAYWARLSFSGKARPPKEITPDTIKMLLDWVSAKGSRIGYAPLSSLPENANVLYIVRKEEEL